MYFLLVLNSSALIANCRGDGWSQFIKQFGDSIKDITRQGLAVTSVDGDQVLVLQEEVAALQLKLKHSIADVSHAAFCSDRRPDLSQTNRLQGVVNSQEVELNTLRALPLNKQQPVGSTKPAGSEVRGSYVCVVGYS